MKAESYLPVDADLIPTGDVAPVAGTQFDFRVPRRIGTRGIDHRFCLSGAPKPIRPVAVLRSLENGVSMTVETTEPGLQAYDGAYMPPTGMAGLDGRQYGPYAGIALETQSWPDAPNRPDFPSAILRRGETYRLDVRNVFRRATAR